MKKFVMALLVLALSSVLLSFSVLAQAQKTEIDFCVGDKTLNINGNSITVEEPYVVGEGVTLVPLRVITEAFGAKVDWIGETKTILIEYEGTTIELNIGSETARVNNEKKELLSAPELTENGISMAPLRFISETFGADVKYDEKTKRITALKEADTSWKLEPAGNDRLKCSSEELLFEVKIPVGYEISHSNKNEVNLKNGNENNLSFVNIGIYSKDAVKDAKTFARNVIEQNKYKYNNAVVVTDTDVSKVTLKGIEGYEYKATFNAREIKGSYRNIFLPLGEYVYNIQIFEDFAGENGKDFEKNILDSIKLTELDFLKIGTLYQEKAELSSVSVTEIPKCAFSITDDFEQQEEELFSFDITIAYERDREARRDKKLVYNNGKIVFEARRILPDYRYEGQTVPAPGNGHIDFESVRRMFSGTGLHFYGDTEFVQVGTRVKVGDTFFVKTILCSELDNQTYYHEIYATEADDALYMFYASFPDIHYSGDNRAQIQSIVSTVKIED